MARRQLVLALALFLLLPASLAAQTWDRLNGSLTTNSNVVINGNLTVTGDCDGCGSGSGSGDVEGPGTSVDTAVVQWSGVAGTDIVSTFYTFTGPSASLKTFTLPNSSATLLYSGGPGGTPSSLNLSNATALPLSSVTGLGSNVATFLGSATSGNFFSMITNETGGSLVVGSDSPTFSTLINLESTGVRLTASDGKITFTGTGNGADESLTIDLDDSGSNVIGLSSSSSANILSWSGFLVITESLQADAIRTSYVTTNGSYTATAANDTIECVTNSCTITLPDPSTVGTQEFTIVNNQTANAAEVEPATGDINGEASATLAGGALSFKSDGVSSYRITKSLGSQLTPVAGGIMYTTALVAAVSDAGTAGQAVLFGGSGAPTAFNPTATRCIYAGTGGILAADDGCVYDGSTDIMTLTGGLNLAAAGVKASASDGVLTLLGLGNGNDENLTLDFDNGTANFVNIGTGTGVTDLTWTGNLVLGASALGGIASGTWRQVWTSDTFTGTLWTQFTATTAGPQTRQLKGRGTLAAPRRALDGDVLGTAGFTGAFAADNSTDATLTAGPSTDIRVLATDDFTASARGSKLQFRTTVDNSTTLRELALLGNAGSYFASPFVIYPEQTTYLSFADFRTGIRTGSDETNTMQMLLMAQRDTTDDWFNTYIRLSVSDGTNPHEVVDMIAEGKINASGTFTDGPWFVIYDQIGDSDWMLFNSAGYFGGTISMQRTVFMGTDSEAGTPTTIAFTNGGYLTTNTTAADAFTIRAYDNDNTTYRIFATLTAGNTPSMAIAAPSGGTLTVSADTYSTTSNCADSAGDAACGAASAGAVVIDAADTNTVVSTTAVTANSQIFVQQDVSLGSRLGVTCNTTVSTDLRVTARSAGTSFTVTTTAPAVNPMCLNFRIVN